MKNPDARAELARDLIEAGLPDSTAARRIMRQFNVVRSTAYCDLRTAHDRIAADPDGPAEAEYLDTAGRIAAMLYDAERCQEAGDFVAMQRLIRCADTLKRWGGMAASL